MRICRKPPATARIYPKYRRKFEISAHSATKCRSIISTAPEKAIIPQQLNRKTGVLAILRRLAYILPIDTVVANEFSRSGI
jgi:hypothetical protein